jgi:hypothetical protein
MRRHPVAAGRGRAHRLSADLRQGMPTSPPHQLELLQRAKRRVDPLGFYPRPVDLRGVRVVVAPWLFRVPGFRRFRGYATRHLILLKGPGIDEDLVAHELCHVWQLQHRPLRVWLSYARPSTFTRDRTRYRANRYEVEARRAALAKPP